MIIWFFWIIAVVYARTPSQLFGRQLCQLTNEFRNQQGLDSLDLSYTLEYIAQVHLDNLLENHHSVLNQDCNLHSWYAANLTDSRTIINNCCYPQDRCMTNKAREITVNWQQPYQNTVAENSFVSLGSGFGAQISPEWIIQSWQNSRSHRALLLSSTGVNCGAILNVTFQTNSVQNLALLWIGTQADAISIDYDDPPLLVSGTSPTPSTSLTPTRTPTPVPTRTPAPSLTPTRSPTQVPTSRTPVPSPAPTPFPTFAPSPAPSQFPTAWPSPVPTSRTPAPTFIELTPVPSYTPAPTLPETTLEPPVTLITTVSVIGTPSIVAASNVTEPFRFTEGMYIVSQIAVCFICIAGLTVFIINRYFTRVIPRKYGYVDQDQTELSPTQIEAVARAFNSYYRYPPRDSISSSSSRSSPPRARKRPPAQIPIRIQVPERPQSPIKTLAPIRAPVQIPVRTPSPMPTSDQIYTYGRTSQGELHSSGPDLELLINPAYRTHPSIQRVYRNYVRQLRLAEQRLDRELNMSPDDVTTITESESSETVSQISSNFSDDEDRFTSSSTEMEGSVIEATAEPIEARANPQADFAAEPTTDFTVIVDYDTTESST